MTVDSPKTLPKTLAEFRAYEGTLFVINTGPTLVTCNTKEVQFQLGPVDGDDNVKALPKELLSVAGFQKLWMRGVLIITADEAVEEKMMSNTLQKVADLDADQDRLVSLMEKSSTGRDLEETVCLYSGQKIFQSIQDKKDMVPPLADEYKHMAAQYVPTEVSLPNGESEIKWQKVF